MTPQGHTRCAESPVQAAAAATGQRQQHQEQMCAWTARGAQLRCGCLHACCERSQQQQPKAGTAPARPRIPTMNRSRAAVMSTAKVQRSWMSRPSRYSGSGMGSAPSPAARCRHAYPLSGRCAWQHIQPCQLLGDQALVYKLRLGPIKRRDKRNTSCYAAWRPRAAAVCRKTACVAAAEPQTLADSLGVHRSMSSSPCRSSSGSSVRSSSA